jgi:hypothetical protein
MINTQLIGGHSHSSMSIYMHKDETTNALQKWRKEGAQNAAIRNTRGQMKTSSYISAFIQEPV